MEQADQALQQIQRRLEAFQGQRRSGSAPNTRSCGVRDDTVDVRREMAGLRKENESLRREIQGVQTEMGALREQNNTLLQQIARVLIAMETLQKGLTLQSST